jgi:hypothetical protein
MSSSADARRPCLVAYGSDARASALAEDAIAPRSQAVDINSQLSRYLLDGAIAALQQFDCISAKLFCVGSS